MFFASIDLSPLSFNLSLASSTFRQTIPSQYSISKVRISALGKFTPSAVEDLIKDLKNVSRDSELASILHKINRHGRSVKLSVTEIAVLKKLLKDREVFLSMLPTDAEIKQLVEREESPRQFIIKLRQWCDAQEKKDGSKEQRKEALIKIITEYEKYLPDPKRPYLTKLCIEIKRIINSAERATTSPDVLRRLIGPRPDQHGWYHLDGFHVKPPGGKSYNLFQPSPIDERVILRQGYTVYKPI